MTNRKRMMISVLLFIATVINDEPELKKDLDSLITHLNLYGDK